MLWTMPAQRSEKVFPTLSILEIALAQAESHCLSSLGVDLICQGTFITTEHFKQIHGGSQNFGDVLDPLKFFFNLEYQAVEVFTFLI